LAVRKQSRSTFDHGTIFVIDGVKLGFDPVDRIPIAMFR